MTDNTKDPKCGNCGRPRSEHVFSVGYAICGVKRGYFTSTPTAETLVKWATNNYDSLVLTGQGKENFAGNLIDSMTTAWQKWAGHEG